MAGWPARLGASGTLLRPIAPWHTAQGCARTLPDGASAATAARPQSASAAAADTTTGNVRHPRRPAIRLRTLLARIRDAVDRARVVVGHEQRAVLRRLDIDGPPAVGAGRLIQPALGEDFGLVRRTVRLERREQQARTDRRRAVPRAVLRGEEAALVFRRELLAGVERHAEVCRM